MSLLDKTKKLLIPKNTKILLYIIVLIGLVLRLIVAAHLTPVEDESGSITHSIGFSKLAPLSQMAQAQVWYYFTDFLFRMFGVSLLTGRLLSVIFGSLSIILVYLIGNMIFGRKVGIIASFLLAVSSYHITWTASYQDETMMFFVLIASYFFIKEYKNSGKISLISAIFLAIAELVKIITGAFIVVFGVFSIVILYRNYKNDKKLFKINLRRVLISVLILAVAMSPILVYNYLLYKEKGIVDLPFAQFLRINPEFYTGPGLHHEEGFVADKVFRNLYVVMTLYFIHEDPLLFLVALLGIVYSFVKFREIKFEHAFFLFMFFFVISFMASSIVLQTHYTSFIPLMSIFGALFISKASKWKYVKKYSMQFVIISCIIIFIFTLWHLREPLISKSALQSLRDYAVSSIDQNTLVLVDSRIYVGTTSWIFNDKNYIDASFLGKFLEASANYKGKKYPIKVLFVECDYDDCGWGTISQQPELNASMEDLVTQFKTQGIKIRNIYGGGIITGVRGADLKGIPFYTIYSATIDLPPEILAATQQTHSHFLYNVPRYRDYKNAFDYYSVNGFFDKTINFFAYGVLYIILILAFVSIFVPFYLLYKDKS
jgi:hypothetical protein